ncbi:pyrimidine/purine nucleoside phosphorylase [Sphingobacterium bovistauri]|uniref:Pyrimidine/purine nucleoside phosphorylase n=1 Tax=Sphingobacterium bovistauri TaxID=2781959 RepID=A0ABS7Z746_9SPHI|nr:pyrimidine/purine nucleoside phosphorylase [Sphingobacterium bovistauri]MCA5004779.1 pyrimidine/purine nucleoside phosphorylase [Sphingobacterium bovistauri]
MINLNEYFEGAVKSLAYENGGKSTVGVIDTGEFEFGTSTPESMLIIEGEMKVLLPGQGDWQLFSAGQQFEVAANASFKVKVSTPTSYLCKYK